MYSSYLKQNVTKNFLIDLKYSTKLSREFQDDCRVQQKGNGGIWFFCLSKFFQLANLALTSCLTPLPKKVNRCHRFNLWNNLSQMTVSSSKIFIKFNSQVTITFSVSICLATWFFRKNQEGKIIIISANQVSVYTHVGFLHILVNFYPHKFFSFIGSRK